MNLEYGDFSFDEESRRLKGILLPFGEVSRPSQTGHVVAFGADDIDLPRDVSVVTLNRAHDRHDPVGRAVVLEKQEKGVYAEFQLADTEEADDYLTKQRDSLKKLSAEVKFLDQKRARLTGAALVTEGAFASAGLFAIAATEDTVTHTDDPEEETPSEEQEPTDTPSEENPINEEEEVMTTSVVPDGVSTPDENKLDTSASALFSALATSERTGDKSGLNAFGQIDYSSTGLFALADITATGTAATVQSQFVGEIWGKKAYNQRVLPLFQHDNLTALKVEGWAWTTAPEVAAYAGDKAAVPSNTPAVGGLSAIAERIAGAHDVDRALRDFSNESFWNAYFRAMTESYAKQADAKVFAKIAAGTTTVAPGTVPSGVPAGSAAIVDGALSVIAAGYTPTFALVSTAIYRDLLLTKKDQTLEFLNQSMGLEEGQLANFKFVPHASLAAKRVIVGAKEAATVYELPGSPIRVEGLDIAKGGIDPAVFGYIATMINDPAALASVTTA
ncbi:hypothetical protein [Microbacterium hominis]|uniref:hypothetical protein n=1 Tax=Microbacterium hominis TaxID=162426 RepID=UPI0012E04BB8|nr:hypothetical protein [Microbacterium hominis]